MAAEIRELPLFLSGSCAMARIARLLSDGSKRGQGSGQRGLVAQRSVAVTRLLLSSLETQLSSKPGPSRTVSRMKNGVAEINSLWCLRDKRRQRALHNFGTSPLAAKRAFTRLGRGLALPGSRVPVQLLSSERSAMKRTDGAGTPL